MKSRWSRTADPKNNLHTLGQNNIHININFNALKDKSKLFANKKIDKLIEVNNEPKSHITTPNISSETAKLKKKQQNGK
jgi:hypothetical protein